jgi:peptide/nickel transport system substrate-binding protein
MKRKHNFSMARGCKQLLAGSALGLVVTAAGPWASAQEPSGTLTVAWPDVYSFVDMPSKNGGRQGERLVWIGVHETPLRITSDLETAPNLAESWTISDDGKVQTVKLREGVQFHGGWGEMTAEDWKWTADDQWQGRPNSNHGGQFIASTTLESVNVVDKYTVEFVLKRPNAFFQEYYGTIRDDVALAIYSKNRVDQMGPEAATTDLPDGGTGPYQIESWTADTEIVLKAFPDYWGEQPAYETVRILQISEPSTVLAALETGEVDVAKIPVTARERVEAAGLEVGSAGVGQARVTFTGQFCYTEFDGEKLPPRPGYDPSKPWVGDCDDEASMETARQVRHAMNLAIDRQALVDAIVGGHGRPTYVYMLLGYFADRYMQPEWEVPYDPEQAKQILADAGYPDGFEFEFICETVGHTLLNEFCEATAGMWSNIGLQPQIRRLAPDAVRKMLVERQLNSVRLEVETGVTPIPEARGFGEVPNAAYNSGFEVPGLAELVQEASLAAPGEQLDEIRHRQYQLVFEQGYQMPLVEFDELYAYNPEKIGAWPRTPWNGHAEEVMDFESIKKPQ